MKVNKIPWSGKLDANLIYAQLLLKSTGDKPEFKLWSLINAETWRHWKWNELGEKAGTWALNRNKSTARAYQRLDDYIDCVFWRINYISKSCSIFYNLIRDSTKRMFLPQHLIQLAYKWCFCSHLVPACFIEFKCLSYHFMP